MLTDFGVLLKTCMIKKGNPPQENLAKDLAVSSSQLSNILNGKRDPDVEFLNRCRNYFELTDDETVKLFKTAFLSSESVTIDMGYFPKSNKEWFVDILVSLLFFPEANYMSPNDLQFYEAIKTVKTMLESKNSLNPMRGGDEKE
jgi:transcriptional regulator with XRE-family HTH domain